MKSSCDCGGGRCYGVTEDVMSQSSSQRIATSVRAPERGSCSRHAAHRQGSHFRHPLIQPSYGGVIVKTNPLNYPVEKFEEEKMEFVVVSEW